ncbi:MAG: FtsX-like permease family protein [Planctomycetota bacterium]
MSGGRWRLLSSLIRGHVARHPLEVALALLGVVLGASVVVGIDAAVEACVSGFRATVTDLAGDSTHRIVSRSGPLRDEDFVELRVNNATMPLTPVIDRRVGVESSATPLRARLVGIDVFTYRSLDSLESLDEQLSDDAFERFQTVPGTVLLVDRLAERLGVDAGDSIAIDGGTAVESVEVVGVFTLEEPAASSAPDLIVADIATAQELTGSMGTLDRIETRIDEAFTDERISAALPGHLELRSTGEAAGRLEELIEAYRLNLLALSMMASFVAVFIVYNASLVSVNRRRETLAILRCVGASPKDLALVFLLEAAVLGVLGAVIGVLLGRGLAAVFVRLISGTLEDLYAAVSPGELSIGVLTLAKGAAVAIGSALLGAAIPVISASRVPPVSAMGSTTTARRSGAWVRVLTACGVTSFVFAAALWISPDTSIIGGYAIAASVWLGFALVTPGLAGLAARVAAWLSRLAPMGRGLPALLAASDVRRSLGVTGIAVAAMMLAMAMNVAILTTVGSFRTTVLNWLDGRYRSDLYIAPELAVEERVPSTLDPALAESIALHPQARDVLFYRHVDATVEDRPILLTATDLGLTESQDLLPLVGESLAEPFDAGRHVFLSQPLAIKLGRAIGDTVSFATPAGPWEATVRGVFHDFVADRGTALVDLGTYRARWGDTQVNAAHVTLVDGITTSDGQAAWNAEFGGDYPIVVHNHGNLRAEARRIFDRTFRITDVLGWLSGLVALCGLTGALLALTTARRREFAVLLAVGASPVQLAVRVASEGLIIALVAVGLAIAAGSALGEILAGVIQFRSFGWTIETAAQPMSWAQALAFALVGAVAATLLPFRILSGAAPSEGLRSE